LRFGEGDLDRGRVVIPQKDVPWEQLWRAGLRQGAIAIYGFWQGRAVVRTVVYFNGHWQMQLDRTLLDAARGQEVLDLYQRYLTALTAHLRRHVTRILDTWVRPIAVGGWLALAIACQSPTYDQPGALGLSLATYGLYYWRPAWGRSPVGWGLALLSAALNPWTLIPYGLLVLQRFLRQRLEAWLWRQAGFFMLLNI